MPKRAAIATTLTTIALVLLLNFKTPDAPILTYSVGSNTPVVIATPGTANISPISGASNTPGSGATATAAPSGKKNFSGVLTGSLVQIPFGPVQVQVTMSGGQITDVKTLALPSGGRSGQIAAYAAPQLRSEVLTAQSAQVNTISGATYTSQGYLQSLQSALDKAV
jgi:uncharacterized protein with FMN-binding domain